MILLPNIIRVQKCHEVRRRIHLIETRVASRAGAAIGTRDDTPRDLVPEFRRGAFRFGRDRRTVIDDEHLDRDILREVLLLDRP